MTRQQIQRTTRREDTTEVLDGLPTEQDTGTLDDIDALLDEIDEILEENAAEIVATYRQRGGQ